jgi:hypothetical protein
MTAIPAAPIAPAFGKSRWGQLAGMLLVALGIGSVMLVLLNGNGGWGVIVLPIALVQLVTGVFVMRHHLWARVLGFVVGVLGIGFGLMLFPSAFYPVSELEAGSSWPALRWLLVGSIVPYVLVLVGLVLGGRHFHRQGQPGNSCS